MLQNIFVPLILAISLIISVTPIAPAHAQKEFPPPDGKGRVVIVLSGVDGPVPYEVVARQIAQLGYDAVLIDGTTIRTVQSGTVPLRTAIQQAQQMPHAIPGKVGLVGFSLGGAEALFLGSAMSDTVAIVVAWYPKTNFISDLNGIVGRFSVPILMFAGEQDTYLNCCPIGAARSLAAAAAAAHRQFELFTYPNTQHAFIYGGYYYNPQAYADALQRTAAALARYIGR